MTNKFHDPGLDNADAIIVAKNLIDCASKHDPESRLLGNLRAADIVRAVTELVATYQSLFSYANPRYEPPTVETVHATLVEDHSVEPNVALTLIGTYASELNYCATAGEAALRIMAKGSDDGQG